MRNLNWQNGFDETSTRQLMKIQHFMALVVLSLATVRGALELIWTTRPPGTSANFVDSEWLQQPKRFYLAGSN
jgi:hypothetical protein